MDESDPMLDSAIELAVESGKISTSLIQRRLSLGYGRAAKIIIPTDAVEAVTKSVIFNESAGIGSVTVEAEPVPEPERIDPCCDEEFTTFTETEE